MAIPKFTMRGLLEAGVHFGHTPRRWNPKMKPYVFGVRNNVHIINLEKTFPMLQRALKVVHDVVLNGGRVLFVGTKNQASDLIAEYAKRSGQYYVNHRWLGGMMTNWKTVSRSIKRLKEYEKHLEDPENGLTKKETLQLERKYNKLNLALGGIRDMGGVPDLLFVIDTNKEINAIKEAQNLKIPIVAIVDSNSDPSEITYPIPGNDDAQRSIRLYCDLIATTVLEGIQDQMIAAGIDIGESAEGIQEESIKEVTEPEEKGEEIKVEDSQKNSK